MRRVLVGDVLHLARAMLARPKSDRVRFLERALEQVETADGYRMQKGTWHPDYGDGSLASWAARHPRMPERDLDNPEFAACLALIFTRISRRKHARHWQELC